MKFVVLIQRDEAPRALVFDAQRNLLEDLAPGDPSIIAMTEFRSSYPVHGVPWEAALNNFSTAERQAARCYNVE